MYKVEIVHFFYMLAIRYTNIVGFLISMSCHFHKGFDDLGFRAIAIRF